MTDIFSLSLEEVAAKIKDAQITSVEVCENYIERIDKYYFKVKVDKPFELNQNDSNEQISETVNRWLEKKILNNTNQWIWSHNRWK